MVRDIKRASSPCRTQRDGARPDRSRGDVERRATCVASRGEPLSDAGHAPTARTLDNIFDANGFALASSSSKSGTRFALRQRADSPAQPPLRRRPHDAAATGVFGRFATLVSGIAIIGDAGLTTPDRRRRRARVGIQHQRGIAAAMVAAGTAERAAAAATMAAATTLSEQNNNSGMATTIGTTRTTTRTTIEQRSDDNESAACSPRHRVVDAGRDTNSPPPKGTRVRDTQ